MAEAPVREQTKGNSQKGCVSKMEVKDCNLIVEVSSVPILKSEFTQGKG